MYTPLRIITLSIVCVLMMLPVACMQNSGVDKEFGTWNFSGIVVDGTTQKALSGVNISYTDDNGQLQNAVTDISGKYFISDLSFGERSFVFSYSTLTTPYTSKRIVVASFNESSLEGVLADVSRIINLYPLTGSVSGTLLYQPKGTEYHIPAVGASVKISFPDSSMQNMEPSLFTALADSTGAFKISGLPYAPAGVMVFNNFSNKNSTYTLASKSFTLFTEKGSIDFGRLVYTTTDSSGWTASMLISNVLSKDGYGKTGIPVNTTVWYKMPVKLDAKSVLATVNGSGFPSIITKIVSDTLFLTPANQFAYDTSMLVRINAVTTDNEKFDLTLDGNAMFRTEKSPSPIEANFWLQPFIMKGRFSTGQTLWVRFSELLDTSSSSCTWSTSAAAATIYGAGASANATFRINRDTLFVTPDQRLKMTYNSTFGFNVQCRTIDGRYIKFYDFGINTIEDPLRIVWTNTKDGLGKNRIDMGLHDTLKVVSSVSGFKVIGVSVGDSGLIPPGLLLSDVNVRGDTICVLPSLALKSDTTYSVDFDLQFSDGTVRRDVLPLVWSTKNKVTIIATNTRTSGMYRPLAAVGDSFTVTFSETVDTGSNAAVIFRVNIKDVTNALKRSIVHWDKECRTATVNVLDTLPTADFDAPAAYTASAVKTRAVESVTFDLITKSGEQVLGCKPEGDPIALHTEKGMCVINTNIISNHDGRVSVEKDFSPTSEFPLNGFVDLVFNRTIDTSGMRTDSLKLHAGLQKTGAVDVPVTISILPDLKTIRITPSAPLETKTQYYVFVKNVPAVGISGAAAINKHGGTFTGKSTVGYLLDRPFKTQ
jgi:hypothetical protein